MVSRTQRTPFADWWWTIDRTMIAALMALMLAGIVLCLAASPPVAARLNLEAFYFAHRQVFFLVAAVLVMLVVSVLSPRQLRRLALGVCLVILFAYGFTTLAMMILAVSEFDAALGRTTLEKG